MSTRALQPLRFPLHGSRLIEASAGTGKTYTLAALYVRLVLGHGGENAFRRALLPPDILVVTFTEAATRELRERIRDRLAEAARCFAGQGNPAPHDRFLNALMEEYEQQQHPTCADRLAAAAQWMDEAAVYTIHGFSNRMLRQHAFDSGSLFNLELTQDEDLLLAESTRDYWRTFCYALETEPAETLSREFATPDALRRAVHPLLDKTETLEVDGRRSLNALVAQTSAERQEKLEARKEPWKRWAGELRELFDRAWENGALPKKKPSPSASIRKWINAIAEWALDPDSVKPELTATAFERLTPEALLEHGNGIDELVSHEALARIGELEAPEADLPAYRPLIQAHAACWIRQRMDRAKQEQGVIGFNDMLTRLRDALHSENGERLAEVIREQYPVALIDEFQDTDEVQYQTFSKVYAAQSGVGWFMIGDPKQAIYGFRGADIHTYLEAKSATGDRHYTLDTNFRSARALVDAVNHLFGQREQEPGDAFLLDRRITFEPVQANDRTETLTIDGKSRSGMTLWHLTPGADSDDTSLAKGEYREQMAARTATEIVRLLDLAAGNRAGFQGESWQPLRPADIAILVRDGIEADAVRNALSERDVRSVYLSDKDNVFAREEASDVLRWLKACAEPESERLVRAALATATLDLSWQHLDELSEDERRWEDQMQQFIDYRRLWQRRGVLPMLRRLLRDFSVPARLLARDDERTLTNLLHLAELLQTASTQRDGEQALVRWLAEQLDGGGDAGEEQALRLESDADLIKVITIHKSKGLEYPLVFLPFVCTYRKQEGKCPPVRYHDENGRVHFSLEPDEDVLRIADRERLAEDLRLLYVATTRARHACWLGIAPMRTGRGKDRTDLHETAIGHLLKGGEVIRPDELESLLRELAEASARSAPDEEAGASALRLEAAPDADPKPLRTSSEQDEDWAGARIYQGPRPERWWIASYSALHPMAPDGSGEEAASAREEIMAEESEPPPARPFRPTTEAGVHGFIRGPMAGTFLHGLLEEAGQEGFARALDNGTLHEQIRRRCHVRAWDDWTGLLQQWLMDFLSSPLPLGADAGGVSLKDLPPGSYKPELEFMFQASHVDTAELDQLVTTHVLPDRARPALKPEQLNGMLKGFIDLVFEWKGRYYVADYKSNWLGGDDSAYTTGAMDRTVLEKRQDVQYSLYLLALHRLLRARLGEAYDYDTHIGGCALLFLRGLYHETGGVHFQCPDRALIEQLDGLFTGREVAHAQ